MLIQDLQNFPIISVSYQHTEYVSVDETIAVYESLLEKQQPFVFVSQEGMSRDKSDHEERKRVASWVKTNRERLAKYVKALIHIEPEESLRLEAQKFANNFIKFSGYPMYIVENRDKADQVIQAVLKLRV